MRRDTPQTLHPLGGITARVATLVCVAVSGVLVLVSSLHSSGEIVDPVAAWVGVAAYLGAVTVLLRASSPFRAPFSTTSHLLFVALLVLMLIAETLSTFGRNARILDGYGYLVVGLFMFPLGSFRPPSAILLTVSGLAPLLGLLAIVQSSSLVAPYPAVVFGLVSAAPTLAVGIAAATFARRLIHSLRAARADAGSAESQALEAELPPLGLLTEDVLPLLERVVRDGELSDRDVDDAREFGSRLRGILVAESEAALLPAWRGRIDDPDRLVADWSMRQRTVLLALAQAIDEWVPVPSLSLTVRPEGWLFRAGGLTRKSVTRERLGPFAAMIGVAFGGVSIHRRGEILEIRGPS